MIITATGAISNAIRGGQWRGWFGYTDDQHRWLKSDGLNALIYSLAVLLCGFGWEVALTSFALMWLGAAPGWGDYIGALIGLRKDNLKENRFLDPLIAFLKPYPYWWGFAGLFLRGLFWGFCLAVPMAFAGHWGVAFALLVSGATMPLAYQAAKFWLFNRIKSMNDPDKYGGAWGLGEVFYGAVLWSPLDAVLLQRLYDFM